MVERLAVYPDHVHIRLPANPTAALLRQLKAEADEM
jgi:hypothetical protein